MGRPFSFGLALPARPDRIADVKARFAFLLENLFMVLLILAVAGLLVLSAVSDLAEFFNW